MRERVIDIRPQDEEARRLWQMIAELAQEFGINRDWCLIGGLMVQLYEELIIDPWISTP